MTINTLWKSVRFLLLVFLLLPVCREDCRSRTIPNRWPLLIGGIGLLQALLSPVLDSAGEFSSLLLLFSAVGALAAGGLGLLCRGIGREGFGWGDIKLMIGLGTYLGLEPFLRAMALTGVLSLVAALYLLLVRHADKSDTFPFAPFLSVGAVFSAGAEWILSGA
ncbi:MAG: prepilin peptidase [Clostridia bacterium]|nr:prepilin peptidase [Clostridia bacterium]